MEIAERAFGPDSTADEIDAIASRVSIIGDRILLMHEIPVQSSFSVNVMFDRMDELSREWDRFSYIADLNAARRPDPETRATLKERVLRISPRVSHAAIVVGNNLLMRAMARVFAYGMGLRSVSVHATLAEAVEETRGGLGK